MVRKYKLLFVRIISIEKMAPQEPKISITNKKARSCEPLAILNINIYSLLFLLVFLIQNLFNFIHYLVHGGNGFFERFARSHVHTSRFQLFNWVMCTTV